MNIKDLRGLKYPDECFIRFFYKNNLDKKSGQKVVEFGCGNGSNLLLPYQYGYEVVGIDNNEKLIADANYNFSLFENANNHKFYCADIREFAKGEKNICSDVIILPSSIYYISKNDFKSFLMEMIKNNNLNDSIPIYIRVRSTKDYRYGLGQKLDNDTYVMPENCFTGEKGALIAFYNEFELVNILKEILNLRNYKVFHLDNQILVGSDVILCSDIVIWGIIN